VHVFARVVFGCVCVFGCARVFVHLCASFCDYLCVGATKVVARPCTAVAPPSVSTRVSILLAGVCPSVPVCVFLRRESKNKLMSRAHSFSSLFFCFCCCPRVLSATRPHLPLSHEHAHARAHTRTHIHTHTDISFFPLCNTQ
jgi:hypothetical protein